MPHVAFLPSSPIAAARLRAALSPDHEPIQLTSWSQLLDLAHKGGVAACVIDVDYPHRRIGVTDLEALRQAEPGIAVVVYGVLERRGLELFHMGRMGVHDVILAGKDDSPAEIRATVTRALARALGSAVEGKLRGRIPDLGLRCLRWAVEHAHQDPLVPDLAEALRVSRRTLSRDLRQEDLPPAGKILMWGRLFRAAQLLESPETTVESVAYAMGYSTGAALGRALRRETGTTPTGLAAQGGVAWVVDSFLRSCRQNRESSGESARWGRTRARTETTRESPLDPYT